MKQKMSAVKGGMDWYLVFFFAMAYAIAWGVLGVLGLIARRSGVDSGLTLLQMGEAWQFEGATLSVAPWLVYLLTRLADFAFSIAGILTIFLTAGTTGLRELWGRLTQWKISWHWYALGLLPLLLYGVATVVAGALPSADWSVGNVWLALVGLNAGILPSLFLRGAMGEELGLRGFALPRLQQTNTPFRASLIIGVLWAAWHLPVLIGRDILSIVVFCLIAIGLSFLFTLLFNGSGGSLIPVLLFHATQNWEEGFETIFPSLVGTEWELISTLSLLVLGIIAGILLYKKPTN
jgi:membrane protease YdiL (CAAX protease family)